MEFKYIATDKQGKRVMGVTRAESISALVMRLKNEGRVPVKIFKAQSANKKSKSSFKFLTQRVKSKELVIFTRQLAAILSAGLLLSESLETIAEDMENDYFSKIIMDIKKDIMGGSDFSMALAKHPKIFSKTYTSIIRSGEATGNLHKTTTDLAKYLENTDRMREKVKSALRYPLFILGFAVFVVLVIVLFLIPKFTGMFASAGAKLPLLTRIVAGISNFAVHNFLAFVIMSVLIWATAWYLFKIPEIRFSFDLFKLKLPVVGKEIIQKALVSRFCRTLAILLSGGVGLASSLDIVSQVVDHLGMNRAIERIKARVVAGASLSDEIKAQKVFPRLVFKMTAVGERTGRIDEMLERTADYYDEELEITLQNLTSLLEPALIIFIGGIVLIVVLALYLPIFKLSTAIR